MIAALVPFVPFEFERNFLFRDEHLFSNRARQQ